MDNFKKIFKVFVVWKNCIDGIEVSYNIKLVNDVVKNDILNKELV